MSIDPHFLPSADAALELNAAGDALPTDGPPNPESFPGHSDSAEDEPQVDSSGPEQRSIEELVELHSDGVWRYLRTLGCDASTADDLTQDTFIRVMRRDSFVQHSDAATASYLRRTAYNLMVSRHRRNKKMQLVAEAGMVDEVWDRWMGKDVSGAPAIDALQDCFSHLTERAQHASACV
ncbi:MAG: sigma-70 family RNA polymerase sigma factor [Planctomycetota bacterium]